MKSLYVVFPEPDKIEVREETVAAPGPDEVLCRAEKSLISTGTESFCLHGVFDPGTNWAAWVKYPFRPGYSMAARVVAPGKEVSALKEGDRVFVSTSHQQCFLVKAEAAIPIPDGLSDEEAPWATNAITTQLAARRGQVQLGEVVGVVGVGMIGQLVMQYLLVAGARRALAIDPAQWRLGLATAHGASDVLATDANQAQAEIARLTGGRMLDAVWDATGNPKALAGCVTLLHKLGRVVLVGDTPVPTQQPIGPGVVSNTIAILGVHGAVYPPEYSFWTPWTRREMAEVFYDYLLQGRMRISDLVTHRFSPAEAPRVYEALQRDRPSYLGVIFDWGRV